MKKELKLEKYNRKSVFSELSEFDYLSKKDSYIEVTEWKNGEGFDINISNFQDQYFNITHGQLKALKKLIKELEK
jgi:hypothetical protein